MFFCDVSIFPAETSLRVRAGACPETASVTMPLAALTRVQESNLIPLRRLTKAKGSSVIQETRLFQLLHILPRMSDASCTQKQAGKGYARTSGSRNLGAAAPSSSVCPSLHLR